MGLVELELLQSGWKLLCLAVSLRSADHSNWKLEKDPATEQSTMAGSNIGVVFFFYLF